MNRSQRGATASAGGRGGPWPPAADGSVARRDDDELAIAAFAAESGLHLVAVPNGERYAAFRRRFDPARYRSALGETGLSFVGRSDREFPPLLRAIHDPPVGLFLRGAAAPELLRRPAAAVVGARACSSYGAEVARTLVVSGLARGIDGEAHRGALEGKATTVAVLGCGIDRDYPVSHAGLAARIAENGLIVSEYAPGVEPAPWRFPARNRIIAGLAGATVVVEARERSGALITADLALEEGREVFAVPGEITGALSAGTNRLLQLGATPLLAADDVLAVFGLTAPVAVAPEVGDAARAVLEALRDEPRGADELARTAGIAAAELAAALTELELAGAVREREGVYRALR